jgi:hypothetical protein
MECSMARKAHPSDIERLAVVVMVRMHLNGRSAHFAWEPLKFPVSNCVINRRTRGVPFGIQRSHSAMAFEDALFSLRTLRSLFVILKIMAAIRTVVLLYV